MPLTGPCAWPVSLPAQRRAAPWGLAQTPAAAQHQGSARATGTLTNNNKAKKCKSKRLIDECGVS